MLENKPAELRPSKKLKKNKNKIAVEKKGLKRPLTWKAVLWSSIRFVGIVDRGLRLIDKLYEFLSGFF